MKKILLILLILSMSLSLFAYSESVTVSSRVSGTSAPIFDVETCNSCFSIVQSNVVKYSGIVYIRLSANFPVDIVSLNLSIPSLQVSFEDWELTLGYSQKKSVSPTQIFSFEPNLEGEGFKKLTLAYIVN